MKNPSSKKTLIIVSVATLVIFAIFGIFSNETEEVTPVQYKEPVHKAVETTNNESDVLREIYIDGCIDESVGSDRRFCACTFDTLEAEIGLEGILLLGDIVDEYGVEYVYDSEVYMDAIIGCM